MLSRGLCVIISTSSCLNLSVFPTLVGAVVPKFSVWVQKDFVGLKEALHHTRSIRTLVVVRVPKMSLFSEGRLDFLFGDWWIQTKQVIVVFKVKTIIHLCRAA